MGQVKMGGPRGKAGEGEGQGQKEQEGHELQASSSLQGPLLPPQPPSLALVVSKFQSEGGAPMKAGAGAGRNRPRTETKAGTKRDPSSKGFSISVQGALVLSPTLGGNLLLHLSPPGTWKPRVKRDNVSTGKGAPGFNGLPWSIHAQQVAQEK